jgi:Bacteriocin-protection, YdeI or OmpD-Associated
MKPSGLEAFALRDPRRSGIYSFETPALKLAEIYETKFRLKKRAWEFFQNQPPGYRKLVTFWVMSAKRDETRLRRLKQLISESAEARRVGILAGKAK